MVGWRRGACGRGAGGMEYAPEARRYGHVVLDEAQDLTPMQLRMVSRRIRDRSMTVLVIWPRPPGSGDTKLVVIAAHLGLNPEAEVKN